MIESNRQTADLISEVIDDEEDENTETMMVLDAAESSLITIAPNPDSISDGLIDDPVTGAGNEDFWSKPECEGDEGACSSP